MGVSEVLTVPGSKDVHGFPSKQNGNPIKGRALKRTFFFCSSNKRYYEKKSKLSKEIKEIKRNGKVVGLYSEYMTYFLSGKI